MSAEVWSTAVGVALMKQFAQVLERHGWVIGPERLGHWIEATSQLAPCSVGTLRLTGHATLCSDPDSLALFDRCYAAWLAQRPVLASTQMPGRTSISPSSPRATPADARQEDGPRHELAVASADDVLRHRDFARLDAAERARIRQWLSAMKATPPQRLSRHFQPGQRRRVDLRRTLRQALRSEGELLNWCYRQPRLRARRRVLLLDVSGSMSHYADALLLFAFALMRSAPADTEVFTVGTRLTRLTRVWRTRDPERALAEAAQAVPDWMGGTLLGEQLEVFLDRWGRRGLTHGAVVLIASDGWEQGDGQLLGAQMARLRRLAHSIVWCNPHKSSDGYQPIARGIRNALPYVDHFVGGCNVDELEQLVQAMYAAGHSTRQVTPSRLKRPDLSRTQQEFHA